MSVQRPDPRRAAARPARLGRWEPWRDWLVLGVLAHGLLLTVALTRPGLGWLLLTALPLGVVLGTATLTVLHDAGHLRFSRRTWPNVLAVQTAVPVGLWVVQWSRKHRVHHRVTQVYPLDDATRASGLVRLHPAAPRWAIHRWQHRYAWALYSLAWAGELRSQLTYLRTGRLAGAANPGGGRRLASFLLEKALWLAVIAPYAWLLGVPRLALLLVMAMTVGSLLAAIATVVGHVNVGLEPTDLAPTGAAWPAHLVRTTASFSLDSPVVRWLTGGLTHHLAHHLRPVAPRSALPALHRTVMAQIAAEAGLGLVEYPTVAAAVRCHAQRLRELGQAPQVPMSPALPARVEALVGG